MLSAELLVEVVRRYQHDLGVVRDRAGEAVSDIWDGLPGYDRGDVPRFATDIADPLTVARDASVALSTGFYSTLGEIDTPSIDPGTVGAAWDPEEPFIAYWRALSSGAAWIDAVLSGSARADEVAYDVVQSTGRRTGDFVLGDQVVGWRRVLTGGSCSWCLLVSTQRYQSAESADFGHGRCDCAVAPIMGDTDPGRVINQMLLDQMKDDGRAAKINAATTARRKVKAADANRAKADRLRAQAKVESDPARAQRLRDRADAWEKRATTSTDALNERDRRQAELNKFLAGTIR